LDPLSFLKLEAEKRRQEEEVKRLEIEKTEALKKENADTQNMVSAKVDAKKESAIPKISEDKPKGPKGMLESL
jgi:hypothetical protein